MILKLIGGFVYFQNEYPIIYSDQNSIINKSNSQFTLMHNRLWIIPESEELNIWFGKNIYLDMPRFKLVMHELWLDAYNIAWQLIVIQ